MGCGRRPALRTPPDLATAALLAGLSARLTGRFGEGYSETNLKYLRQFYIVYADRTREIRHEPRDESTRGALCSRMTFAPLRLRVLFRRVSPHPAPR